MLCHLWVVMVKLVSITGGPPAITSAASWFIRQIMMAMNHKTPHFWVIQRRCHCTQFNFHYTGCTMEFDKTIPVTIGVILIARPPFIFGGHEYDEQTLSEIFYALLSALSIAGLYICPRKIGNDVHYTITSFYYLDIWIYYLGYLRYRIWIFLIFFLEWTYINPLYKLRHFPLYRNYCLHQQLICSRVTH